MRGQLRIVPVAFVAAWIGAVGAGHALAQAPLELAGPAETLVRGVWLEGLPIEQAAELGSDDGALLAEMLADPAESAHHANIVVALGACACGPAFEALAGFDSDPTAAAKPYEAKAAQRAIPQAMGLLARRDARALGWLENRASQPLAASDRTARRRRVALMQGLALSQSPRADALLADLEAAAHAGGDAAMARRAGQAREHWRRARDQSP